MARRRHSRSRSRSTDKKRSRSRDRDRRRRRSRSRDRRRSRSRDKRSRSRDRTRDKRSRSRDRKRSRSKDRKRSRSKDRKRKKSHSPSPVKSKKSKSPEKPVVKPVVKPVIKPEPVPDELFDPSKIDKEEAERRLEAEMQKRRERIEKWRAEKKKRELEQTKEAAEKGTLFANLPKASQKAWSLEDDDEEDDDPKESENKANQENELDPLDAFMTEINDEVRKIRKGNFKGKQKTTKAAAVAGAETEAVAGAKKPFIIMGVAKATTAKKEELIEQNQDGLEYSSEEEGEDIRDTMASLASKGKKEIAKVDHKLMEYVPFRKDFYVEVPEIANMTKEEINIYRVELEGIRVKGQDCPKPIKTWAQCGVSKRVLEILKKCCFEKPTPIQSQAIPAVMKGRDVIGIAKTGSGKTLAFLLPLIRHVVDQPPLEPEEGPIAIIMTPTRELCMQIGKDCRRFVKNSLHIACVYGGTGISEQIAELKRGAEIIVCTPGRMIDMLAANNGRVTNLRRVSFLVLDEADRMFDLGFEPQVMRIIANTQPARQTVMFSATFPRQVEALAKKILNRPLEIMVGGRSVVCKDVKQEVAILDEEQKFLKLLEILGKFYEEGQTIVFVDKQESADALFKDLLSHSYRSLVLHGGVDQIDRDTTISDFKAGRIPILVATSVAARGLDVKQLILVVNYDAPNHYEDYVHRCGRTGRAGNKGYAYTFILRDNPKHAYDIIKALELSETPVPEDLKNLWEAYKAQMESEGKKVRSGGNFHGKGFKFDENEANLASEKKKFEKAALGLEDSDDEDIEGDINQEIETLLNTKRTVKQIKVPPVLVNVSTAPPPSATTTTTTLSSEAKTLGKLELAKRLAQKINIQHTAPAPVQQKKGASQQAAEYIMKGGVSKPLVSAKTVAEQMAQKLNSRLNYQPSDDQQEDDFQEESQHKYEEELEINEFPQQARWRVTSKEALQQISEYSEAGITVRGTYCPDGKKMEEGERKLFLAIESISELAVSKAKVEIIRLIKEELIKIRSGGGQLKNLGRYKVV